jgi:hypothetical protein
MTLFLVPVLFRLVGQYSQPRSTIAEKIEALMSGFSDKAGKHAEPPRREHAEVPPKPAE